MNDISNRINGGASEMMNTAKAYESTLLEISRRNMTFWSDYMSALASVRSPADFVGVGMNFTMRRISEWHENVTALAQMTKTSAESEARSRHVA